MTSEPITVFIADHSTAMRMGMAEMLAQIPNIHVVATAPDVQSAVKVIGATRPDVAIIGLKMFGGSGLDVLAASKRISSNTFTIVFSGGLLASHRRQCLQGGADAVLEKPHGLNALFQLLREFATRPEPLAVVETDRQPAAVISFSKALERLNTETHDQVAATAGALLAEKCEPQLTFATAC